MFPRVLKPTKQRMFNKKIFGFDIETANDNKEFVVASIVGENYKKFFYTKGQLNEEVKNNKIFRNAVIFATNLSFDFFGTFFNEKDAENFFTLFRGSDLLLAKTYFYKEEFHKEAKIKTKSLKSLLFLDSMNFAKLSVAKMGEIIGLSKLKSPSFLGKEPQSEQEWKILKDYNLRDSEITLQFMEFLIKSFETLGATFKNTLASTSMSLFKNKYLDQNYFQPSEEILIEQFKSYYGGRTEVFKRGYFKDYNYYDFNSLYPSVMVDEVFPNPNTLRITRRNDLHHINNFEGISDVDIFVFPCKYPILPVRNEEGRVIFPTGNIRGWYTHIELREAIKQGAVVKKVHKTQYFLETCTPFKGFMEDLYNFRNDLKAKNNPMEYVVKITMNSLYGKFGQKFLNRDNWIHVKMITEKDLEEAETIERKGEYIRLVQSSRPSSFCIPIWASYVTAYGRIKLHRAIEKYNPIYCDTDSLITRETIETSNQLGDLKLEMKIDEGIVVRPKFYALKDSENDYIKIKGLAKRLNFLEFIGLMHYPKVEYDKFTKFKEALRRNLIPNQIIQVSKEFSLEDEKRIWKNKFNYHELEDSVPLVNSG